MLITSKQDKRLDSFDIPEILKKKLKTDQIFADLFGYDIIVTFLKKHQTPSLHICYCQTLNI